jgi:hypothetical protein
VPRAANSQVVDLALGEGASEMRTAVCQRISVTGPSDEHHGYTSNIDSLRYRLFQVPFRQRHHEVVPVRTRRVVNADPPAVYEMPAEIGCAQRYRESETADRPSRSPGTTKPERERDRVKSSG